MRRRLPEPPENKEEEDTSVVKRYPTELFIDSKTAEQFVCPICMMIPADNMIADDTRCGTVFCKPCIKAWTKERNLCPHCRRRFDIRNPTKNTSFTLIKMHRNLAMKCAEPLCKWTGSLEKYQSHNQECALVKKKCKYSIAGCTFMGKQEELKEHELANLSNHLEKCYSKLVAKREESKSEQNEDNSDSEPLHRRPRILSPSYIPRIFSGNSLSDEEERNSLHNIDILPLGDEFALPVNPNPANPPASSQPVFYNM